MSEILVRIPLTGQSDFHPLALAPGLPMLDVKKLTYQVLLGWFGDLLAEPEFDEHGVTFHVQRSGRRKEIVERTLATEADLAGPLESDFERLKKALFDVKPVSPSERLIFNRLQPPIGNYDGYLYRVLTKSGSERLVWCWGFQCRNTDARATVCPNAVCSMLLQQVGEELENCPHCNQSLLKNASSRRRSRFPLGAFSAATILLGLCGGTVWLAASRGNDMPPIPGLALLERVGLSIPMGLSAGVDEPTNAESTHADPAETQSEQPQPPSIILPDPAAEALDTTTVAAQPVGTPENRTSPASEAGSGTDETDTSAQPPRVAVAEPNPAQLSGQVEPPEGERPSPEPATRVGTLAWHQDYQTAYKQATQQRRQLLVVFRDTVDPESINSLNNGLAVPGLATTLDAFVRLALPANTTIPGQSGGTLLLEHRAFRHMNLQPGIAIVDLTDPESTWYGRVVSALPQSPNGRFSPSVVKTLLDLPHTAVCCWHCGPRIRNRSSLPGKAPTS